jgi:hypothetical protein
MKSFELKNLCLYTLLHAYTTKFNGSSDEISSIQIIRSNLKIINYLIQLLFYCKDVFVWAQTGD